MDEQELRSWFGLLFVFRVRPLASLGAWRAYFEKSLRFDLFDYIDFAGLRHDFRREFFLSARLVENGFTDLTSRPSSVFVSTISH